MHRVYNVFGYQLLGSTVTIDPRHISFLPPPSSLLPSYLSFPLPSLLLSLSTSPSPPSILLPSLQSRVRKLTETNEEVPELKQRLRVLEEKHQANETRTRELEVR